MELSFDKQIACSNRLPVIVLNLQPMGIKSVYPDHVPCPGSCRSAKGLSGRIQIFAANRPKSTRICYNGEAMEMKRVERWNSRREEDVLC